MRTVIFINSLSHSGSTLLDIVLGGHSKLVGLGEIGSVLRISPEQISRTRNSTCSCGKCVNECSFWGGVLPELFKHKEISFDDKYRIVLNRFWEKYDDDCILVDSSKNSPYLQILLNNPNIQVKVIHLIKDVRAYTISQIDNLKRKNKKIGFLPQLSLFLKWHKNNNKIIKFLKKKDIEHITIGYEHLCLQTENVIENLCNFMNITSEKEMISLSNSNSHVIRGNRMRHQPDKRKKIIYDHRWFQRNEWMIGAILFPYIMKFNDKFVYGLSPKDIWNK